MLAVFSAFPLLIFAMEETLEGRSGEADQYSNRVFTEEAENEKFFQREQRSVKNNSSLSLADIEKRLQAMEESYRSFGGFSCGTNA